MNKTMNEKSEQDMKAGVSGDMNRKVVEKELSNQQRTELSVEELHLGDYDPGF